ncbi:MAG: hypothetical protein C0606_00555 [Hyphomicrobiales bacterium]|nr:MAG: hypothetical protein C0606_00555 [Hyphomicrobiales bacterium]
MNAIKPWYRSKTVWAAAVTIAASVAGLFGFTVSAAEQAQLVDVALAATTSVSGAVALIGRVTAKSRIR